MDLIEISKHIMGKIRATGFLIKAEKGIYIGKGCSLKGGQHIKFSQKVSIRPHVQIWCESGLIQIGAGSEIGERSRISIANSCKIGVKVLISPNVYITDCDHEYQDIDIPIMEQGVVQKEQKILIGDETYIGINSVIVGNVSIGKHCVIGANSVVTRDIPDYSVAVGSPAKIIKRYDKELKKWIRVKE